MVLAIVGTLFHQGIVDYTWIAIALVLGTIIGVPLGMVQMTAVPQRTALSHAFGTVFVTLVGTAEYYLHAPDVDRFMMGVLGFEVILGSLTFTGSLMAAGKLQEVLPQRPITFRGQNVVNLSILGCPGPGCLPGCQSGPILAFPADRDHRPGVRRADDHSHRRGRYADGHLAAQLVRRSLRRRDGVRGEQQVADHCRRLDGASGFILSVNMSKAMNRSFTNVLFGAFGQEQAAAGGAQQVRPVRSATADEAAAILAAASKVVIVPGYGMAVAQAQHKVRELFDALTKRGVDVKFAIHPVAGRMPGHMNVLLAEADIPYDHLLGMEDVNGDFPQTDVRW